MSKVNAWIFNILILIGLIILFLAIGSFIPPFLAILGILFLTAGIYIGFKSTGTSKKEEILDSQEIPVEIDQGRPSEVARNLVNSKRQSKSEAIQTESEAIETKKEEGTKEMEKENSIAESGYRVGFNVERGGGQVIFHLHLHLVGGW